MMEILKRVNEISKKKKVTFSEKNEIFEFDKDGVIYNKTTYPILDFLPVFIILTLYKIALRIHQHVKNKLAQYGILFISSIILQYLSSGKGT